ncbi:MAG: RNA polymerase subunit sigma-70, partial [Clostridia bacterium]|nr:RNA polymerase subunit sigma-70 [Clostridia bacterium]
MNDDLLVQRFLRRDESALSTAREAYGRYCFSIAQNVLRNEEDSEEALNEALLAAWNSIPPQRPKNLKTYLGKLIREI